MAHWLLKSEPSSYSWDRLVADGRTHWDGVRNPQALNNLRAMKLGDRAFFYHSNEGKEIVGVAEVVRTFYSDPNDKSGKLGMVDIRPVAPARVRVGLKEMRANSELVGLSLLKQSRLSVCPVSEDEWSTLCRMAGIEKEAGKSN
jgi:predicted RNA-binding protein with PUA-like domain